jgi:hypothetical protein
MARPAVLIETVPPATPDALPRMDVAAFVGFADAGPVDVPVAIEDLAQFDEIFDGEPILAYDAESAEPHHGYLRAAVESFLATGGRRCWVVRAADAPGTRQYTLEGLVRLDVAAGPFIEEPVIAPARSPGIVGAGSSAHATLIESPLIPFTDTDTPALDWHPDLPAPALRLRIIGGTTTLTPGALLRLSTPVSNLRLFVVVERIDEQAGVASVSSSQWVLARSVDSSTPDEATSTSELLEFLSPALLVISPASSWAGADLRVDLLDFEISIWRERALQSRMANLQFSALHQRFFGNLPDDDTLFFGERTRRGDRRDAELLTFWDEARGSRHDSAAQPVRRFALGFPAAPAAAAGSWPLYLPQGMSRLRQPAFAEAEFVEPALRSGNEPPSPAMFVDSRLATAGGDSLRRSAESIHGAARDWARTHRGARVDRLRGVHALLPIDEVTLIGLPDVVHRRWSLAPRPVTNLLAAPELLTAAISAGGSELAAEWTRIDPATSYVVQVSAAADFSSIVVQHEVDAVDSSAATVQSQWPRTATCGGLLYLRVGARRRGEPSPWSITRFVADDTGAFQRCGQLAADRLLTTVAAALADGSLWLRWTAEDPLDAGTTFEVQSAGDPLFTSAPSSTNTSGNEAPLPLTGDATGYWRVRVIAGDAFGPWSNTVAHTPPALSRPILDPRPRAATATSAARGYDDSTLLEVHRGLLRFCQARGDLVSLLTLPRHYGPLDVSNYLASLLPTSESLGAAGRRLTLGEADVLSYGALFHPWVAHRLDLAAKSQRLRFTPADGIAAGALAGVALERGAWIAAANRVLTGVLALDPILDDVAIDALHDRQVNVLMRAPIGFVFIDSETLSRDSDTRPLAVRRLLILLKRLALREGMNLVFEPNDEDLRERVQTDFERVLSRMHQSGAFRGTHADDAFRVVADGTVNSQADVDAGRFTVELRVAPSEPLKFLRVRLTQNGPQSLSVGEA